MTDPVERLHDLTALAPDEMIQRVAREAADEIERLRAALEHIAKETEPDDLTLEYAPTSTAEFARAALKGANE